MAKSNTTKGTEEIEIHSSQLPNLRRIAESVGTGPLPDYFVENLSEGI